MPRLTDEQRTPAWFEARRGKITASVAAACVGLDPHRGPLSAYNEIMGLGSKRDNRSMAWGRDNESRARELYEAKTGEIVAQTGFWVSDTVPWLGSSPDGLVAADGLLEVKCPARLPDGLPTYHRIQCLAQLIVVGRAWCDYWAVDPQDEVLAVRVYRSPRTELELIARLEWFYRAYVLSQTPPPRRRKDAVQPGKLGQETRDELPWWDQAETPGDAAAPPGIPAEPAAGGPGPAMH